MENPKFTTAETLLGSFACLIIDLFAAIADLFTFGVVGFFSQTLSWLVFTFWFNIKGVKVTSSVAKRFVIPIFVQLVPVIPTTTATFLVTVYMENHPERFAMIEKAASLAKKA